MTKIPEPIPVPRPPSITLRTDIDIVQLPATLPNWGTTVGANTIQTDPDFGTKIMRLTDANTYKGNLMGTNDGAAALIWNTDDTMLIVTNEGNGKHAFGFNPSTLRGYLISNMTEVNAHSFSRVQNNLLYVLTGTQLLAYTFSQVNGQWTTPTSELIVDFASYLPAGFVKKWQSELIVSLNDQRISVALSNSTQDTPGYVCVYDFASGVRVLDTNTGQVTGQWGELGTIAGTWPQGIHAADQTPNPDYLLMGEQVWHIPELTLMTLPANGHNGLGYVSVYTSTGGGQFVAQPYTDLTDETKVMLDANLPYYNGQHPDFAVHCAFGLIDTGDDSILWASTYNSATPFPSAWSNEIIGLQVKTGVVYRACHTFNSGNLANDMGHCATGCPSQTGKFVAFTSDIMGAVGVNRADVFIVQVG